MRKGVRPLNKGFVALLKSDEVMAECETQASRVLAKLSDGYEMEERNLRTRRGYVIRTATPKAMADNLKHNSLTKAVKGG